jgi:hypothetical protein
VVRRLVGFFQPSFKLKSKTRDGARVHKVYFTPATPCDRLLAHVAGVNYLVRPASTILAGWGGGIF